MHKRFVVQQLAQIQRGEQGAVAHGTFLSVAREIAYSHHEKWDGSGYPLGLRGENIPLSGRLMAVADVYDALISKRSYKAPMSHEAALEIIRSGAGKHFDPDLVTAFLAIHETFRNIALTYADYDEERLALGGAPAGAMIRGRTFLVVEDHDVSREIISSQLIAAGGLVTVAVNGHDACEQFRRNPSEVILTDIEMPEMDGYKLAAAIRALPVAGCRPLIFAITASDYDINDPDAHDHGVDGYMLKQLELPVLEAKLARLIGQPGPTAS